MIFRTGSSKLVTLLTGFVIGILLQQLISKFSIQCNNGPGGRSDCGLFLNMNGASTKEFFSKKDSLPTCNVIGHGYFTPPNNSNTGTFSLAGFKNLSETVSEKSSRLLCLVHVTNSNFKPARSTSITWGKRCNKVLYFGDTPPSNKSFRKGFIQFKNKIENSWAGKVFKTIKFQTPWEKAASIWRFVHVRHLTKFDWFLIVEDDTYVIVENLKLHLQPYDPLMPFYTGYTFRTGNHICAEQKPGYILSQGAVDRFVKNIKKCSESYNKDNTNGYLDRLLEPADRRLASCIRDSGIPIISGRDSLNRQRFLPGTLVQHILKPVNINSKKINGFDCCSDAMVAFQMKSAEAMQTTEYSLYQLHAYGIGK